MSNRIDQLNLYDHQQAFVEAEGNAYLQGARQSGKTYALCADILLTTVESETEVIVYGPTYSRAMVVWDGLRELFETVSDVPDNRWMKTKVELDNGSTIDFRSSSRIDPGSSDRNLPEPDRFYVDEPAYIEREKFKTLNYIQSQKNIPMKVVGSPYPGDHPIDGFANLYSTTLIWSTVWDNPEIDEDHISAWSGNLDPETELRDLYGVTPPDAYNR